MTGTTFTITWLAENFDGGVAIALYRGGAAFVADISTLTENTGTFEWTVPTSLPTASDYNLLVSKPDFSVYNVDFSTTFQIMRKCWGEVGGMEFLGTNSLSLAGFGVGL